MNELELALRDLRAMDDGEDLNADGEELFHKKLVDLANTLTFLDRFRACPICQGPLICFDFKGRGSRYICGNAHLITINTMSVDT